MTVLLTILFVLALLVLVAGGLLASDPCLNPSEEAPRTFPGPGECLPPGAREETRISPINTEGDQ